MWGRGYDTVSYPLSLHSASSREIFNKECRVCVDAVDINFKMKVVKATANAMLDITTETFSRVPTKSACQNSEEPVAMKESD